MADEQRSARVLVRIAAAPDSDLNRVLNGTVDATRRVNRRVFDESVRAQKEQERVSKRQGDVAAREAKRAADAQIKEAKRAADTQARDAQRSATRNERETKRAADAAIREAARVSAAQRKEVADAERYKQRVAEAGARLNMRLRADEARERQRSYRTQIRDAERAQREETRIARNGDISRRRMLAGLGGAAVGAGVGVFGLVGQGQSVAGVGSLEQRLGVAGQFQQQMIRTGGEAGINAQERAVVEERALKVSEQFNLSILDISAALAKAQSDFDQFRPMAANLEALAKVAAATDEPLADLVGTLGNATRAFQLDEQGQRDFLDALISTSARGSIKVGEFARNMSGQMGVFSQATGRTGIEGAREFLALGQVMGKGGRSASETETMIDRLRQQLERTDVQQRFKSIGINVTQGGKIGAKLTNWQNIARQFGENPEFQKAAVQQRMFGKGSIEATQAARTLIAVNQNEPEYFNSLQFVPMGEGDKQVDTQFGELQKNAMFRLQNVGVRAQAATVRDADRIAKTITPAVEELTKLQSKFPLLTESFSVLNTTIKGLIVTLVADRLLFGRSLSALTGSARSASDALGGAAGGGGLAGKLGTAGQAVGVFAAAFFGTKALLEATGADKHLENAGAAVSDLVNGTGGAPRQAGRGFDGGGARTALTREERTAPGRAYEDAELLKAAIREGNRKDPVRVVLELKNGALAVTRTNEGQGATVDYSGAPIGFVLP